MSAVATTARADTRPAARRRAELHHAAFALLLALGAVLVVVEMRGLSFFGDEWDFLLDRRGISPAVLLKPHGPHLSVVPIVVYKVMLKLFGMHSYAPYKGLAALDAMLIAAAVGVFARRRWGPWWGLAPVLLVVTLGAGGPTLLWPFQVGYALATAAGVVALVALDRGSRGGDVLACAALVFALASGSQGIGVLVGAAVMIALGRDRVRRAWVIAVPVALYGLWYAHYGHQGSETHLGLWHQVFGYSGRALAATLGGLVGFGSLSKLNPYVLSLTYDVPLALGLLVGTAAALIRGWRPSRLVLGVAITLVVLWVAAALSNAHGVRPPNAGRYLPTDAALLLIGFVAALPRPRFGSAISTAAVAALAAIAVANVGNFAPVRAGYAAAAKASRSVIGALQVTRGVVSPGFHPGGGPPAYVDAVSAGSFFSAVGAFGTNAYSPSELLRAPEDDRELADSIIVRAERLALAPSVLTASPGLAPGFLSGPARLLNGCLVLTGQAPIAAEIRSAGVRVDASRRAPALVALARFGHKFVTDGGLGTVAPGTAAAVRLPPDRVPQVPWRISVIGRGARVCPVG